MIESIKVLGPGCAKCKKSEENVLAAVKEMQLDTKVEKVDDIEQIIKAGIMSTPGMMINGEVVSTGRLVTVKDAKAFIEKYL